MLSGVYVLIEIEMNEHRIAADFAVIIDLTG